MEQKKRFLKSARLFWLFGLLLVSAMALAACQSEGIAETGGTPAPGEAADPNEPVVGVTSHPDYGEILVDRDGRTLYIFMNDTPNQSNCTGDCLVNWPPLVTNGRPQAGEGVNASLLGTANLEDGSLIATYNGRPLYYWAADTQAGQTSGQGVGGVWYVVGPDGNPIMQ